MLRTALRLGILPLLAILVVWESASGPMPVLWWPVLCIFTPFIIAAIMVSFLEAKDDPPTGVVPRWARRAAPVLWIVSVVIIVSVVQTEWPLRSSFGTSKPQLEQLIDQARQGKAPKLPQQIGWFNVTDIHADDEVVILYLNGADGGDGAKIQYWFAPGAEAQLSKTQWKDDVNTVVLDEDWILYAAL